MDRPRFKAFLKVIVDNGDALLLVALLERKEARLALEEG